MPDDRRVRPKRGTSLVLCLSDLHFGKNTETFDIDKAHARLMQIPKRLRAHPSRFLIPEEIVVALVGDIVEGEDIFASQNIGLTEPVITQADTAASSLWSMLKALRAEYPLSKIRVETSIGNHGRMSKSASGASNWDAATYTSLALHSMADKSQRIQVNASYRLQRPIAVQGTRGLLYHHGLKHLGTPAMHAKFLGWLDRFDCSWVLCGHWHHARFESHLGRQLIGNGTLGGPDDLSDTMGVHEPPRQVLFFVTGERLHGFDWLEWEDK